LAEEKNQSLSLYLERGLEIKGDRDLLFQALANLLDNAVKYTPSGGKINITLLQQKQGFVEIIVADNGAGIPVGARENVLQRFYRLEAARNSPGNGLGLSLVAAVASLHHGQVRLEDNAPGLRVVLELIIFSPR